jgi:V/A-type H+/Na+-transporting ATPase subunit D
MAEFQRELVITRVALLELKDERRFVKEGYDLLDEKRILLATAIRRQLEELKRLRAAFQQAEQTAVEALKRALRIHGLDELSAYPPLSMADDHLRISRSRLLGLELIQAHWQGVPPAGSPRAVNPTPEARACAMAFRDWLALMGPRAAASVNLRRLVREYVRTERRARAIENVLLPEIESVMKQIEEQLESQDQEEIARLRQRRTRQQTPSSDSQRNTV